MSILLLLILPDLGPSLKDLARLPDEAACCEQLDRIRSCIQRLEWESRHHASKAWHEQALAELTWWAGCWRLLQAAHESVWHTDDWRCSRLDELSRRLGRRYWFAEPLLRLPAGLPKAPRPRPAAPPASNNV